VIKNSGIKLSGQRTSVIDWLVEHNVSFVKLSNEVKGTVQRKLTGIKTGIYKELEV
jgi:hypothetical protein